MLLALQLWRGLEEKVGLQKAMLVVPLMYLLSGGWLLLCREGPGHREAGTRRQVDAVAKGSSRDTLQFFIDLPPHLLDPGAQQKKTEMQSGAMCPLELSHRHSKSTLQYLIDTNQIQLQASRHKLQDHQGAVLPGL